MFRRDLLIGILQALFLALFPWLRNSERGLLVARQGAERAYEWAFCMAYPKAYALGRTGFLSSQPEWIRQAILDTELEASENRRRAGFGFSPMIGLTDQQLRRVV